MHFYRSSSCIRRSDSCSSLYSSYIFLLKPDISTALSPAHRLLSPVHPPQYSVFPSLPSSTSTLAFPLFTSYFVASSTPSTPHLLITHLLSCLLLPHSHLPSHSHLTLSSDISYPHPLALPLPSASSYPAPLPSSPLTSHPSALSSCSTLLIYCPHSFASSYLFTSPHTTTHLLSLPTFHIHSPPLVYSTSSSSTHSSISSTFITHPSPHSPLTPSSLNSLSPYPSHTPHFSPHSSLISLTFTPSQPASFHTSSHLFTLHSHSLSLSRGGQLTCPGLPFRGPLDK
ncbi:hypothetical protein QCA50_005337 [Cerrena zonata]|uniref:Uncharacterized protein n=1 Tax=Cerrena zonata TaxID=2478898 RepID=A0AAW0GPU9_9APHY